MKRFLLFFQCCWMMLLPALAQQFHGRVVVSGSGASIPFANVYIVQLQSGTTADSVGNFLYRGTLPHEAVIRVSAVGFNTRVLVYEDEPVDAVTIELEELHMSLPEFVVCSPTGVIQRYAIANIESKTIDELKSSGASNLTEALTTVPGVYSVNTGAGISKPVIRGLSGMRVVTYLNGLRIENQQWGGDHGLGVNEVGLEGVEVIKGPSSLLYGGDALGGVLYFTDENFAAQHRLETEIGSRFESNSMRSSSNISVRAAGEQSRFNLSAGYGSAADYALPSGGFLSNSRFSESNLKFAYGLNRKNWVFTLRYGYMKNVFGLPGHTHEEILTKKDFIGSEQTRKYTVPAQNIQNHYLLLENAFYGHNKELRIWLGNTTNTLKEFEDKITIPDLNMTLNNSTYNARYKQILSANWNLVAGIQGMYQVNMNAHDAPEKLLPDALTADNGVFTVLSGVWKGFDLQAGARFDNRYLESFTYFNGIEPLQKFYNGYNYSAGLARKIDSVMVRMNVSSGYRAPHLSEMLADGVHHGSMRYEIGSVDLRGESATQVDLSAEYITDHLRVIINPFVNRIANYIYLSPADTMIDSYRVYHYRQHTNTLFYGGDYALHFHPHFAHALHLENSISVIRAHSGKDALPLTPPNRIATVLRIELDRDKFFGLAGISGQHQYLMAQDEVAENETITPDYHLFNVFANLKYGRQYPVEVQFGVRNLLNSNYVDHLSRLKPYGLSGPGRNYFVSINYLFNAHI